MHVCYRGHICTKGLTWITLFKFISSMYAHLRLCLHIYQYIYTNTYIHAYTHNRIREKSACVLAAKMEPNTSLKTLILDGNPLGMFGSRYLSVHSYACMCETRY